MLLFTTVPVFFVMEVSIMFTYGCVELLPHLSSFSLPGILTPMDSLLKKKKACPGTKCIWNTNGFLHCGYFFI